MGKTEQGAVWLNSDMLSDYDYWQFWRNCDDTDCKKLLLAFTDLDPDVIETYFSDQSSDRLNEAKILLANEQTKMCRGESAQKACYDRAKAIFSADKKSRKEALEPYALDSLEPVLLIDFLLKNKLIESKSIGKKLIEQRGVRLDDVVVDNVFFLLNPKDYETQSTVLSLGKKRHYLIVR
jgi:tyrosyl-tRNA synthetase